MSSRLHYCRLCRSCFLWRSPEARSVMKAAPRTNAYHATGGTTGSPFGKLRSARQKTTRTSKKKTGLLIAQEQRELNLQCVRFMTSRVLVELPSVGAKTTTERLTTGLGSVARHGGITRRTRI